MGELIKLAADNTTAQLVNAAELLMQESINTIINIDLEELDSKQIGKLAKLALKQIDDADAVINILEPVPDVDIQRAVLQLHSTIDSCFVALNQHYSELQNRILTLDCDTSDLINYAEFCHQLAMKLLSKATTARASSPSSPTLKPNDEELSQYL